MQFRTWVTHIHSWAMRSPYISSTRSHFAIQRCFPTEMFLRLSLPPMSRLNQTLPKIGNLIWGQRVGKAIVESDQNKWKNATERTPKFAWWTFFPNIDEKIASSEREARDQTAKKQQHCFSSSYQLYLTNSEVGGNAQIGNWRPREIRGRDFSHETRCSTLGAYLRVVSQVPIM